MSTVIEWEFSRRQIIIHIRDTIPAVRVSTRENRKAKKQGFTGYAKNNSLLAMMDSKGNGFGPKTYRQDDMVWGENERRMMAPAPKIIARNIITRRNESKRLRKELESYETSLQTFHEGGGSLSVGRQRVLNTTIANRDASRQKLDSNEQDLKVLEEMANLDHHLGWTWAGSTPVFRLPGKTTRIDFSMIKVDEVCINGTSDMYLADRYYSPGQEHH